MTNPVFLIHLLPYLWIAACLLGVISARLTRHVAYYAALPAGAAALVSALLGADAWKQSLLFFAVCFFALMGIALRHIRIHRN